MPIITESERPAHNPRTDAAILIVPGTELQTVAEMTTHAERIVEDIKAEHRLAQETADSALEHAAACGRLLLAQKNRVGYGNFGAWFAGAALGFCRATAANYMWLAHNPNALGKSKAIRHLYPSGRIPRSRKVLSAPPSLRTSVPGPDAPAPLAAPSCDSELSIDQAIAVLEADDTGDGRRRLKELARTEKLVTQSRRRLERAKIAQRNAVASVLAAARKLREAHE